MFGSWFDHVKSWLDSEDKERMFYISYEEMIIVRLKNTRRRSETFSKHWQNDCGRVKDCLSLLQDLKDSVTRIAGFLGKSLEDEVMEKIAERCLFKNMKQNKMSNYSAVPTEFMDQSKSEFLRKGVFLWILHIVQLFLDLGKVHVVHDNMDLLYLLIKSSTTANEWMINWDCSVNCFIQRSQMNLHTHLKVKSKWFIISQAAPLKEIWPPLLCVVFQESLETGRTS